MAQPLLICEATATAWRTAREAFGAAPTSTFSPLVLILSEGFHSLYKPIQVIKLKRSPDPAALLSPRQNGRIDGFPLGLCAKSQQIALDPTKSATDKINA